MGDTNWVKTIAIEGIPVRKPICVVEAFIARAYGVI